MYDLLECLEQHYKPHTKFSLLSTHYMIDTNGSTFALPDFVTPKMINNIYHGFVQKYTIRNDGEVFYLKTDESLLNNDRLPMIILQSKNETFALRTYNIYERHVHLLRLQPRVDGIESHLIRKHFSSLQKNGTEMSTRQLDEALKKMACTWLQKGDEHIDAFFNMDSKQLEWVKTTISSNDNYRLFFLISGQQVFRSYLQFHFLDANHTRLVQVGVIQLI
jgi:hypothetical protein